MELILAEELLLLALHDEKGSTGFTQIDPGLAGALLVDLGRLGAVRSEGKELAVVTDSVPQHPVLGRAHAAISASAKRRSAKSWVGRLPGELKPLTATIAASLVDRGVLTEQRSKFLGLFPSTRFPEANPEPERALRSRLRAVLLGERAPTTSDALLLGLLVPLDLVGSLVDSDQRRTAKKWAKEIADGGIAGTAVSDAVRDIQSAVMVAVMVPVVTAGSN
ncbi:MAG: GOLPH3/VPS74 family protein [Pseudonocardiaceae bacterium]